MSLSIKHLLFSCILFLLGFSSILANAAENNVPKTNPSSEQGVQIKNPASDLWRAVRQREFSGSADFTAKTQAGSNSDNTARLINAEGNQWRKLRREQVIPYGSYFIIGVVVLLLILTVLIKRKKIPEGRSGKVLQRMSVMQRISHWLLAFLVIFMAITGLFILFGRFAIIPIIGAEAFSPIASASKEGHNLFGPIIIVSILLMLIHFIRHNLPAIKDIKWLFTAGGLIGKGHLKIGFFNAGEKLLYWITIILGISLAATGLLLLFPEYQESIGINSQLSLIIHAISALLLVALSLAHVWMVRTVEGTLEAITQGAVDENWAKAHHSVWYEQMTKTKAKTKTMETSDDR